MQGDGNDILYDGYSIDFLYIGRQLFEIFGLDGVTYSSVVQFFTELWQVYTVIALIVSFFLVIGIVYAYIRYNQMGDLETLQVETQERLWVELYGKNGHSDRWNGIEKHLSSENPNDWKLAIIEADVMLEEALDGAGYAGLSIGDKLKSVSPSALASLDDAWSAHKVRNAIAHGHDDFVLTKKIAQDTIVQYRKTLQELGGM